MVEGSGLTKINGNAPLRAYRASQKHGDNEKPHRFHVNDNLHFRGKNFLHTAIIKGDLESLLFLISIHVNVQSKVSPIKPVIIVSNEIKKT
jgi:hypothetical protein